MTLQETQGYITISKWLSSDDRRPFLFQEETWAHVIAGRSGLVNAPTGCGKTFSVFLGALIDFINRHPGDFKTKANNGLQLLWISPLRALARDIGRAMEEVIGQLGMQWKVGIRNGDTEISERQKQKRKMPEVLIITPESLHLLLAQKGYHEVFKQLRIIAVDEWHELLGSKRGVQVELAVSRIVGVKEGACSIIGISATIGNLEQARDVLLAPLRATSYELRATSGDFFIVRANIHKNIQVESILPDEIEKYPWAGHLGLKLILKVLPILERSRTTLIFINTRGMSERWYQSLLDVSPDLAGAIALHHGSVDMALRNWVEEALHEGKLKAVVTTASLDLGVDFRPVEMVIQVGSPKGVARFLQRAGRSGHQPGEVSKIFFLPTHSLELMEAAALKSAMKIGLIESREPMMLCYDVLIQYLSTLAISEGFHPATLFTELKSTYCYADMTEDEWGEILHFITAGGAALHQYDEFKKVEIMEDGVYKINSRRIAMRHRLHIGTIVSDAMLKVRFITGGYVGVIEEYFISRLSPGDVFTLAGRNLEFVMIKDMTALVRKSNAKKAIVPSWNGGRMPLSANLGMMLRKKLDEAAELLATSHKLQAASQQEEVDIELKVLLPLFQLQAELSYMPRENELLIEQIETKDGFHLFVYPFEGRLVHEAMAALLAYRISRVTPISFSFAMNDYGFELLSDQPIPVDDTNVYELFSPVDLTADIQRSVNSAEMARRKFRDIAVIGGLIFQGYPGEYAKPRHLQSSASLLFNVFTEYDPDNLLIRQAYNEVMDQQMEEVRLRNMLERIQKGQIVLRWPDKLTPFCFPLKVDSMREDMSSEKLEDRVKKMQAQLR
ncbi:ligase-associated DNA damage response DEXH box helicase [Flavitalea sp. BT771]|uniref:ligase-associated DNA damage response DEXH box helicase n=1 Tax=Flavitalea sp. BT771 TaxID=3063329 RepID=UPI0026E1B012|nr:ligase-associated DNA damage response DEXH box helicase [Flavitalea sp. BT771]MDO6429184.1 ligase-associated DNA damage response DEXH box helicase [Flavitalea sp. BT771]MDV6218688.1 ligase-associated DNA damage response DEXH box helicase [Flavitalea sp. BT771]